MCLGQPGPCGARVAADEFEREASGAVTNEGDGEGGSVGSARRHDPKGDEHDRCGRGGLEQLHGNEGHPGVRGREAGVDVRRAVHEPVVTRPAVAAAYEAAADPSADQEGRDGDGHEIEVGQHRLVYGKIGRAHV